jgi:branched-chain amino acid transport system substrate-binding protein
MTKISRRGAIAGLATTAALRARAQDRPVRIGVVNDPNGVYADNGGVGCVIAARLAAEEAGNTLLGRPVEILHADCANKADLAASIVRQWIDQGGVDVIVDGASSGAGLAIQQVTREKERIYIAIGPATSDLTGRACSPFCVHVAYDTYALAKGTGDAVTKAGGKTWFFITADYAFGEALQRDTTRFLEAAGGRVLGAVRHPLGTSEFSSYLLQAQSSGADVIALANAGTDTQNCLKQAAEFGVGRGGKQHLAALLIFITDVFAVGLPVAGGLNLTTSFYWDRTDATRAFTKRFMAAKPKPPSMLQAATYTGVKHWLACAAKAGTVDAKTVMAAMKATPINDMNNTGVTIRADGRVMCDMYLMRVKTPAESHGPFDVYDLVATLSGDQAFRPLSEGGCGFVT